MSDDIMEYMDQIAAQDAAIVEAGMLDDDYGDLVWNGSSFVAA